MSLSVRSCGTNTRKRGNYISISAYPNNIKFHYADLSCNNLTQITTDNFRGQDGLLELNLSKNHIHRLPSGVFHHLQVSVVCCNGRRCVSIQLLNFRIFRVCVCTRFLSLSLFFSRLQDLRKLNLAENSINELTARLFLKLSKLKHLDLSGNSLEVLPPEVFRDVSVIS